MARSLEVMAEELTCSICLGLFTIPVTIPCGHNFCYDCLDTSWSGDMVLSYSCPQCRYNFAEKPELRKNTILSNLVSQLEAAQAEASIQDNEPRLEEVKVEKEESKEVMCDTCRNNVASKTCLTCMASFCQEHLMPHLESPVYLAHQLSQPLRDLRERMCAEHSKLIDHYCESHGQCVCCYCALTHKQCQTVSLQEGKKQKEMQYINLLRSLNQKLEKTAGLMEEVRSDQRKVLDTTKKKKDLVDEEFEEIKALIQKEKDKAMMAVQEEEKKLNQKCLYTQSVLTKKKQEYVQMKSRVQAMLEEQDDLQFLKKAGKMKDTLSKDPFKPKTDFDDKLLQNIYKKTVSLKETIKHQLLQPEEAPDWRSRNTTPVKNPGEESAAKTEEKPEWRSRAKTPVRKLGTESFADKEDPGKWNPLPNLKPHEGKPHKANKAKMNPANDPGVAPPNAKPRKPPHPQPASITIPPTPDSREQLLQYAEKLTVNFSTAHKKIVMSDMFTKLQVSDHFQNYPNNPHQFISCSQVLCLQSFAKGTHYWEVIKEGGNFSGIGVAYSSIPRSGTESRLGRNKVSWCIEWCNNKLQAWHNDKQTDLTVPNTNKYGVLLNYDEGFVSFFCVGKKFSQIYKFRAQFSAPVYPAFWLFSSPTELTLCQVY